MADMGMVLIDETRTVLRLGGADVRPFLQGLVTNDIGRLAPDAPLYAAILTPQGKYLFDFILVDEVADGSVLLDVAADRAQALAQRLGLYRLRKAVSIEASGLSVVLAWPPGAASGLPGALAVADPRHPGLGQRVYTSDPQAVAATPDARAAYEALRIGLGVPQSGLELIPEESFILEAGFERLHGVDFRKGCYVGQEVTARMKHKTELRKGLARVAVEGAAPAPGTPVMAGGRPAGTLHSVSGPEGLAHLRFDRAEGEMTAGDARLTLVERL